MYSTHYIHFTYEQYSDITHHIHYITIDNKIMSLPKHYKLIEYEEYVLSILLRRL